MMHKQNLNGETEDELFEAGINAQTLKETRDLQLNLLHGLDTRDSLMEETYKELYDTET
jgi:hypothetical protein